MRLAEEDPWNVEVQVRESGAEVVNMELGHQWAT